MGLFGKKKDKVKTFDMKHVVGLDLPQDVICSVIVDENQLTIISTAKQFNIKMEKVRGIDFDMNVDIETYMQSSMMKGLIGAATFGVAGAVIGSAPKGKEKRMVTAVATLSYTSQEETKYIVFQSITPNDSQVAMFTDALRPFIKNRGRESIDL